MSIQRRLESGSTLELGCVYRIPDQVWDDTVLAQKRSKKMMDLMNSFMADMKAGPAWVYNWVMFMGVMFMLSIAFSFKNKQARLILLATLILAPIIMMALYGKFGYERILGLGHIMAWTPILYVLLKDRKNWRVKRAG
ncbi:MAG: hypothetical protein JKX72_09285 [Robiginitomaculum sp.]|nr:hypothetical protein [Robiginitomaculum sp.]